MQKIANSYREEYKMVKRANSYRRGYNAQWRAARLIFLGNNPLCVKCLKEGKIKASVIVDHVTPHRGDMVLFWDERNWQALCKFCHDSIKQREERGRVKPLIGEDGWPVEE